jgi:hypothetical protein
MKRLISIIFTTLFIYFSAAAQYSNSENTYSQYSSIDIKNISLNDTTNPALQTELLLNEKYKGGPENALLSLLVPGLGDYFVKDHREMLIKPYIKTAATLGLIGLGILASNKRHQEPMMSVKYKTERYDSNNDGKINYEDATHIIEVPIVIGTETKNWLFSNDAELFFIAGTILWIADVVWVLGQGSENEKYKQLSKYNLGIKSNNGFTGFSLSYKF